MTDRQRRATLYVIVAVVAIVAFFVSVTMAANTHDWLQSPAHRRLSLRIALITVVYVAVVLNALLPLLLWVMFLDREDGQDLSPLMVPLLLVFGGLTVLVDFGALAALDRLRHGLMLGWAYTNEPELVIVANAVYLVILAGVGAFLAVTMLRRRWSVRATVGAFGLVVAAGAAAVLLVLTV